MTLTGLYVPLITPFDDSGAVAWGAWVLRLQHANLGGMVLNEE